jgi:glycine cleavage system H protein
MAEFKYTKDHECIYIEGDVAFVGISKHAQDALGDLVYIDLPEVGKHVEKGGEVAVVESVKTAAEVYAPVDGVIVQVNEQMADDLDRVSAPVNENGWIVKVRVADVSALNDLMDQAAYDEYLKEVD